MLVACTETELRARRSARSLQHTTNAAASAFKGGAHRSIGRLDFLAPLPPFASALAAHFEELRDVIVRGELARRTSR